MIPRHLRSRSVLVDTSAFYGVLDRDDQWHGRAVEGLRRLAAEGRLICSTNLVVAEVHAMATRRLSAAIALGWLNGLTSVPIIYPQPFHESRIRDILNRYRGIGFSYTDAFSVVAMDELEIPVTFTFDRGFQRFGLNTWA